MDGDRAWAVVVSSSLSPDIASLEHSTVILRTTCEKGVKRRTGSQNRKYRGLGSFLKTKTCIFS
jgi:hypothetical protein